MSACRAVRSASSTHRAGAGDGAAAGRRGRRGEARRGQREGLGCKELPVASLQHTVALCGDKLAQSAGEGGEQLERVKNRTAPVPQRPQPEPTAPARPRSCPASARHRASIKQPRRRSVASGLGRCTPLAHPLSCPCWRPGASCQRDRALGQRPPLAAVDSHPQPHIHRNKQLTKKNHFWPGLCPPGLCSPWSPVSAAPGLAEAVEAGVDRPGFRGARGASARVQGVCQGWARVRGAGIGGRREQR